MTIFCVLDPSVIMPSGPNPVHSCFVLSWTSSQRISSDRTSAGTSDENSMSYTIGIVSSQRGVCPKNFMILGFDPSNKKLYWQDSTNRDKAAFILSDFENYDEYVTIYEPKKSDEENAKRSGIESKSAVTWTLALWMAAYLFISGMFWA